MMLSFQVQLSDSSPSESSLWSVLASTAQVAAATLAVLSVAVLLAVAWRHNPSVSTALRSAVSSVLDAVSNRRRCARRMPSHVRHRLRLRLPAAAVTSFDSCVVNGTVPQSAASVSDSPSLSATWAPQMLSLYAKKQRQLQLARKDSGDCDAASSTTTTEGGIRCSLPSLLFADSSRQQTPRELLPVDFEDAELTFFNRRLELLVDD